MPWISRNRIRPGKALLAEHLEIGAVIGAALVGLGLGETTETSPRGLGVDRADLDAVLAIGLEAAAERVILHIIPGPGPDGEAGAGGLVALEALDRLHPAGEGGGQEGDGGEAEQGRAAPCRAGGAWRRAASGCRARRCRPGRCAPRCRSGSAGRRRRARSRTIFTRQSGGKMVPKWVNQRMSGISAMATVEMVLLS